MSIAENELVQWFTEADTLLSLGTTQIGQLDMHMGMTRGGGR